ncbi:MAG: hypothetical protein JXR96_29070 [Deltaproteobacteria bacterium]|nr:hypothetical protein [Deltaproteobacteria bacterium]
MKTPLYWLLVVLSVVLPGPLRAGMELNGAIATENYLGVREGEFYNFRNANLVQLKLGAHPAEEVAAFANLELRNTNFTGIQTVDDLWDRGSLDPISWRINEAYVDLYGFLLNGELFALDLRAGKQVLGWGEGDGFNPSNPLDPFNLENPLDFKARIGNVGLKATLTVGEEWFSVEGVVIPRFLPAVVPVDLFIGDDLLNNPLMPSFDPAGMLPPELAGLDLLVLQPGYEALLTDTPGAELANVMGGARVRWAIAGFDWTVSYAHGRQSLPVPKTVHATAGVDGCPEGAENCLAVALDEIRLIYPEIEVLGFDLRGDLGGVGLWGEVAVVFPRAVDTEIVTGVPLLGEMRAELVAIEEEPFTKWVLGAEYTFPGGYYFNLQWVHGFFAEMTGHKLHDYLFFIFRKSILADRLKFELALGGELDTTLGRRSLGGLGNLLITYKPFDGSEVALGYVMARGEDGTTLEMFEKLDQVYLRFRADF